ncbi:MAG TPA: EAL domain-containing protein [Cellulomonas sp.]|uniref:putative bifunctional diguanylate cyclase/phosphodiesterase n=1 Tax=Cellulomonas sp. TaxID=40001 RepID=UPI002E352503|nr:EAL domain-containing protein [Cellulomonas sp.]HEX5331420.1 EAL domain-containing protein [Cellulomonas sp.]
MGTAVPRPATSSLSASRVLIDALQEGVLIADPDGRVLEANAAATAILGVPRDQLIGGHLDAALRGATTIDGTLLLPDDRPPVVAARTGETASAVVGLRPGTSDPLWLRLSASPLSPADGDGDEPGRPALIVTMVDVTTERLRTDELRRSEERFRLTFEDAAIGMAIVSLDGRFLQVNQALVQSLGIPRAELLALTFQQITHPDDIDADLEQLALLLDGAIPGYQVDKRYVTPSGSVIRARLTVSLAHDAAGRPLHFITQVEDVTAMRRAQDVLEHRALYDHLTGLANRSLLLDRLNHALAMHARNDKLVAVVFADLDHFKRINDSLGHDAGDRMLRIVADRMRTSVRPGDTVARIGGDEFVVVLEQIDSAEQAGELLQRIQTSVELPLQLDGHLLLPLMSAGLTVDDGSGDALRVLRDADTAMYVAKNTGRGRWVMFGEEHRRAALDRLSVEGDLRAAIENGDFELHYQPIVDLASRDVSGYEALVRWRHPERGLVLPESFIEIADDADLTPELGSWVLREAVAFLARHPELPGRLYINVSPRELGRVSLAPGDGPDRLPGGLARLIAQTLETHGVAPSRLGIEIAEAAVLEATEHTRAELGNIARLGVAVLLDDFGTGYSALLSALAAPVTGVKLDRSFTTRLGEGGSADRVSSAVAAMVASLGSYGIASGLETEEQAITALSHGWQHGQGWLFGRPLPEALMGPPRAPRG